MSGDAKAVAAGSRHSIMLKEDGSVWATGYNNYGQLGDGSTTNSHFFVLVISDEVKAVAAGAFHSMLLKDDGSIWATGSNKDGQFGDGTTTPKNTFIRLDPFCRRTTTHTTTPSYTLTAFYNSTATTHSPVDFTPTTKASSISITIKTEAMDGIN